MQNVDIVLPKHIGFIMDGNGRWAKERGLPRFAGHQAGMRSLQTVLKCCKKYGIPFVSLYVFSTENWSRPQKEIDGLFDLARQYLKKINQFMKEGIRLVVSGNRDRLPEDLVESIQNTEEKTKDNDKMTLNLCMNYGGRAEIVAATNKILQSGIQSVDEKTFSEFLFQPLLPEVDLVVRTSGEMRTSNFMLYQSAYAEFYFCKTMWPEFDQKEFSKMLDEFARRTRKFGDVK